MKEGERKVESNVETGVRANNTLFARIDGIYTKGKSTRAYTQLRATVMQRRGGRSYKRCVTYALLAVGTLWLLNGSGSLSLVQSHRQSLGGTPPVLLCSSLMVLHLYLFVCLFTVCVNNAVQRDRRITGMDVDTVGRLSVGASPSTVLGTNTGIYIYTPLVHLQVTYSNG